MTSRTYTTDQIDALLPQGANTGDQTLALAGNELTISGDNGNTVTLPTSGGTVVSDASNTVKGVLQLAGDLAGTAAAPTVPALTTKANLLTIQAVSTATTGTLAADTINPIDASAAAVTRTLPNPTATGQVIEVEKTDSSTNTVTISGTVRGAAGTLNLVWQYETIGFIAESLTSWRPIYGHKTKTALDNAYAAKSAAVTPTLDSQPTSAITTIASDSFTGAAQTALTAHTTDQGAAWTLRSGSAYVLDGTGKATFGNTSFVDGSISTFDAGASNYTMTCNLTPVGTSASDQGAAGLVFRWVSTTNFYYASFDIVNKLLRVYKNTTLVVMVAVPTLAGGTANTLRVDAYGPDITISINGVEKISFDDLTNTSSRIVGLRSGKSGTPVAIPTWGPLTLTTYQNTRMNWPRFQKGIANNPLVALGTTGTYDSTDINNPNVVWDPVNNRHVMYYTAYYDAGSHNGQQKMALAYSTTGPLGPYVKEAANPVNDSYSTDFNTENGGFCFAIGLRKWFHAYHAGSNQKRIGLQSADSPAGPWTRIGYLPNTGGAWDIGGQYDPFMRVREDGYTIECWYAGADTTGARSIGRMTSVDGGQTWLAEANPVVTNPGISAIASFAEPSVYVPPAREGQQMLIFYDICPITSSTSRVIGCAMTLDGGTTWRHKIVSTAGTQAWESNQVFDSFPYYENGRLYLFHSAAPAAGLVLNIGIQIGVDVGEWDARTLTVNASPRTALGTAVSAT